MAELNAAGEDAEDSVQLTVFVDSQPVAIPADIGVDADGGTADLFTSDSTGEILFDPAAAPTLGDFFEVWRTNAGLAGNNPAAVFDEDQLLGNFADTTSTIQMFVNGSISTDFDNYALQDSDEIVLVFGANPVVSLNTNFGPIVIELFEGQTPGTVDNFLNYINDGDYIDSFFHRSVVDFVIQGGGFTTTSTTFTSTAQFSDIPTDDPIQNEPGLSNVRGTVAMAKVSGDADSATSQFFVNLSDDNTFLDSEEYDSFTVFGQVLDMTTVDEIAALPIDDSNASPFGELPLSASGQLAVIQSIEGQGELTGVKFLDHDADGVRDAEEPGIAGATVFVDSDNNGVLDAADASTTTDADGRFLFQVAPGTCTVWTALSSGRVATLPYPADGYTVAVEMGREVSGLDFGEATLSAPASIDLLAAADSGVASDDNLTNWNNATASATLQFLVTGVTPGAEVRVYADGSLVGAAAAAGSEVTLTTDGATALADGAHSFTATQLLNNVESDPSGALVVVIDTVPPADIVSAPLQYAKIREELTYDVDSPDEGLADVRYWLVGAPEGMTIDADGVIRWTPQPEQAVPQEFEIRLTDDAGNSAVQAVHVTVLGDIPAYPDSYSLEEDSQLVVDAAAGVLANDGDEQSGVLEAVVVDPPTDGSLTLHADGSFIYTPNADFFGEDSFTYMASDGDNDSNVAKVTLEVAGVNDPPVAAVDAYSLDEDSVLTVDASLGVLANDTDPDGDTLTATLTSQASNGVVTLSANGSFTYTPDTEFSGDDSFTYTVSDGAVSSGPVTVSLEVAEIADPPIALADSYSVDEDDVLTVQAALGVLANDTDPDSSVLTATVTTEPTHGVVTLSTDGSFAYTPESDFFGSDSFTYVASDGVNTCSATTVTITVDSQPDPPVARDDPFNIANDGAAHTLAVLANDTSEPDADQTLSIVSVTQGSAGGAVAISNGAISYTAPTGFVGTETFTYTIEDTDGLTDTATVSVSVTEAGDNSLSGFVFIDRDGDGVRGAGEVGVPGVLITLTGADNSGESIARTAITLNDGSYAFTELPSGTYQLTESQPAALMDGPDSTSVSGAVVGEDQFTDIVLSGEESYGENNFGEAALWPQYVSIAWQLASTPPQDEFFRQVTARCEELAGNTDLAAAIRNGDTELPAESLNYAPIAIGDSYSISENGVLTATAATGVLANDIDPNEDPLTATLAASPANGAVTLNSDGSFTYTPNAHFNGTDWFTYLASDGLLTSNAATVTITVNAVGDAPVAGADTYVVDEDSVLTLDAAAGVLANDTDPDGDSLNAQLVSGPTHGTAVLYADGSFTYTPNNDFSGSDSFTYLASDGLLTSSATTVTITVNPANDAPVAAADTYAVDGDNALTVGAAAGVLANDSDPDGDSLTAELVSGPAYGAVTLSADGSFTYTPNNDFSGSDSFTYLASDGLLTSSAMTATITVNPANDAPVVLGDTYVVDEDHVLTVDAAAGVLSNDTDADGDSLTAQLVSGPTYGVATFNADGSFTYTPNDDFSGTDWLIYLASDGLVGSTATVTITVQAVNDAPIPADDVYRVLVDDVLVADAATGVLANDEDADNDTLTATLTGDAENGSLDFGADGSFTYTPNAGFHGVDAFRYTITDGAFTSDEATVSLYVNSQAVVGNDGFEMDEDTTLARDPASGVLANDTDADGDVLMATLVSEPANGTVTLNPDGSFVYAPNANFCGADSFTYTANDGLEDSAEAAVTITVRPINDAPASVDDAYSVAVDEVLVVEASGGVLANDNDVDGDVLTVTLGDAPTHGTLTLSADGSFTYTPNADFSGADSFTYVAADGMETSGAATVTITVDLADIVQVRLEIASTEGAPISAVSEGEPFVVNVYVEDLRSAPQGVFSAYFDLLYHSSLVAVNGPIEYSASFPNVRMGDTSVEGVIDEAGACSGFTPNPDELLLLSVPFIAVGNGSAVFVGDPADAPGGETLLFGLDTAVPSEAIRFADASVQIAPEGGAEGEAGHPATFEELVDQVFAEEKDWLVLD